MYRVLRAAPAFVLLLVLQASPAAAHARFEASTPGDGQTVSSPPSQVDADFSEPVTSDSFLEVTDPCGNVVSGSSRPVADKVSVSMSGTRAGTYSVFFRVQSSVDSHVTEGSFSFASSGGDPCPGEEPPGGSGGGNDNTNEPSGGGSGRSDDDNSDPGSPGGDDPAAPTDDSGTSTDTTSTTGGNGGGGGERGGKGGSGGGRGNEGGGDGVRLAVDEGEKRRRGPDPWDLPMDGLLIALGIAALIGAAGGRIYASIMGPRA
jgi:methionine-rich copper-binding protein CopC